jgi:hypothetical protein
MAIDLTNPTLLQNVNWYPAPCTDVCNRNNVSIPRQHFHQYQPYVTCIDSQHFVVRYVNFANQISRNAGFLQQICAWDLLCSYQIPAADVQRIQGVFFAIIADVIGNGQRYDAVNLAIFEYYNFDSMREKLLYSMIVAIPQARMLFTESQKIANSNSMPGFVNNVPLTNYPFNINSISKKLLSSPWDDYLGGCLNIDDLDFDNAADSFANVNISPETSSLFLDNIDLLEFGLMGLHGQFVDPRNSVIVPNPDPNLNIENDLVGEIVDPIINPLINQSQIAANNVYDNSSWCQRILSVIVDLIMRLITDIVACWRP